MADQQQLPRVFYRVEFIRPRETNHQTGKEQKSPHADNIQHSARDRFCRPADASHHSAVESRHDRPRRPVRITAFARDVVRGVHREWVRNLYGFAVKPDIALYFKVPIETSLKRILNGRISLKFHEAGMDLNLSTNPADSFKLFQGKVVEGI